MRLTSVRILAESLMTGGKDTILRRGARRFVLFGLFVSIGACVAVLAWSLVSGPLDAVNGNVHVVDESKLPQLPAPDQLPPISLPRFKYAHPRLPRPSAADLATIAVRNPAFLRPVRARAAGGSGDSDAVALQELAEPGSIDLDTLHRRLMGLKFTWRGHDQGKPLALA